MNIQFQVHWQLYKSSIHSIRSLTKAKGFHILIYLLGIFTVSHDWWVCCYVLYTPPKYKGINISSARGCHPHNIPGNLHCVNISHYCDVIIVSQITSLKIVYSAVYSRADKKPSKLRITGLCEGNSPVTGEFPAQRASNAENDSIWWRHHDIPNRNTKESISPQHKAVPHRNSA